MVKCYFSSHETKLWCCIFLLNTATPYKLTRLPSFCALSFICTKMIETKLEHPGRMQKKADQDEKREGVEMVNEWVNKWGFFLLRGKDEGRRSSKKRNVLNYFPSSFPETGPQFKTPPHLPHCPSLHPSSPSFFFSAEPFKPNGSLAHSARFAKGRSCDRKSKE